MLKKIDFYVEPRQCGKTNRIINEVKNFNGQRPLIVVLNQNMRSLVINAGIDPNSVISQSNIQRDFFLKKSNFDKIWIDEYLYFYPEVIEYINDKIHYFTDEVCVRTTPYKMIDTKMYDFIKNFRSSNIPVNISFDNPEYAKEFEYLYHNLLTHPKTNLLYSYKRKREMFNDKEVFEIECLGKLFKEDE